MTAPLPDGDEFSVSPDAPKRTSSSASPKRKNAAPTRATLARKWAYLVTGTAYLPYTHAQIEEHFSALLDEVFAAVLSDDAEPAQATEAGARLVALRCVGPDSLRRTMEVLGKGLLHEPELRSVKSLPERVLQVLGALASGYGEALRESIQTQQEDLSRTLVTLERETRRELVLTQARFEQLFTGSKTGVAVTRVDGRVQRVNPAFAEMLNRPVADLIGLNLYELVHSEDADGLREGPRKLLEGETHRLELSRRLVTADDEEATWAGFTGAVIRDPAGEAQQLITLVDGDTDVSLLQRQLSRQALHDPLTGLPNRQFFGTRLERALRHADPAFGVTVYHLDLDGFSLIAGGLGQKQSDALLKNVAGKLRAVVGGEDALVARIGGDEFGILIQNTAASPDVATVIGMINQELSEPVYLEGGSGVAVSACVGVVHRPPRDIAPNELLRVSDMTLRRAQSNGYRQWALSDSALDTRERHEFGLAVSMAGAWETGEIEVHFRPLTWLEDSRPAGIEARLAWNHPRHGRIGHDTCVRFANETGLIVPLGEWLIRTACEESDDRLPMVVGLTPHQAADPDLVGSVRRVLTATGLGPSRLRLGFPAGAVLAELGETVDNLHLLAEIGVDAELQDFGVAGDVVCLVDVPVRTVRIAPRLAERRTEPLAARALRNLIETADAAGATVIADGIDSTGDAGWWRSAGAHIGAGRYFG
ncbi:putative bifunctional diguanylate cyclase/phosphodiesterase [Amycolatopsis azurea]|uniref:GGDEF domain-containing protein n=1 Tax=Amycolatopsis azurea DSM 43854 TaxID=1238180 RepID=M2P087_9PSEU|nr:EAL domain-containing protein [Amycolatopsis azurea]EMD28389.1 Sensory box/GGDEF family protein [Amycolatopsis azurea DSM 43854]OOC06605.1 GGDEF domain-containing protein [Amycolatopsis azurea DSM 43854]